MATYIDTTNAAIFESGTDLDPIAIGDFPSPLDPMQTRFKNWTGQAWRELQQERNEWQFRNKMAQFIISPRFLVVDGDRATAPPVGAVYSGDETDATFTVLGTTLLSGSWAAGTAEAWIDFEEYDETPYNTVKWGEYYDESAPDPSNVNVFRMKWWGRYNLIDTLTDCLEPDLNTFFIQSTGGSTQQDNDESADNRLIRFVSYNDWLVMAEQDQVGRGRPTMFTITPEGFYDFYPRLDKQYLLTFTYSVKPQELSAANDVIESLPSSYTDAIKWRTVMYYAMYDNKPQVYQMAERRYETYKNRLERNQMPKIVWSANRYNSPGYGYY